MATDSRDVTYIQTNDLHFDHHNPRLAEYGITQETSEEEILQILWDAMDVRELTQSISASGFFPHEALIVTEEEGKNIVIEGNRRLAAVRILLDPSIAEQNEWDVEPVSDEARSALEALPTLISPREESWRFLGFKHVNGAAKWSSYAKAKYIGYVHSQYGVALADIAKQIGDGFGTVKKLYRGLMVLEQAERTDTYDLENRYNKHLSFSHLYTGIQYQGFRDFLSLKDEDEESESPVPEDRLGNLKELCSWLYGDKREKKPPVVKSQNPHLRQLNEILLSREATAVLRDGAEIGEAFEFTRTSLIIFEEALLRAKRELLRAKSHLATGYDKSESLLRVAGTVATTADSIYSEMEQMRTPEKKERLTEE
ncbi:MAG: hypothetical protein C0623_13970 [Desulfuromonas sp.]|nr:MAG: hypothetical protein C0623_13970 [Desulfuromonas sp.]